MSTVRLVVISDLHLGGQAPFMMARPEHLASFIRDLPKRFPQEPIELVIAGDFIDFLAIPPRSAWTSDPREAEAKLATVLESTSPFRCVMDALGRHVEGGHRLTILVGNHDVELVLDGVQKAFCRGIGVERHDVRFVDDGRAYRVGRLLIEHGNGYDGANENDWNGLREWASAASRDEKFTGHVSVSPGSRIVEALVNPIKETYPFIDLLEPSGRLLAFLLLSFEPDLLYEWDMVVALVKGGIARVRRPYGRIQPVSSNMEKAKPIEAELAAAFGDLYDQFERASEPVGALDQLSPLRLQSKEGLRVLLEAGQPIPPHRLAQMRAALRAILFADRSFDDGGPVGDYGAAAEELIANSDGIDVVVMGHTHLARQVEAADRVRYINTGTWADLVRVTDEDVASDEALTALLKDLLANGRRRPRPTFASLQIDKESGRVLWARLEDYPVESVSPQS